MKIILIISLILFGLRNSSVSQVPYLGGNGSGYQSVSSTFTNCGMYFGGNADGATVNATSLTSCTQFFGGISDGAAANLSVTTVCPQFLGNAGDGYATDSTGCVLVLPIKLLVFYGEKEKLRNVLHWKAEDGFNVQQFEIEKSSDGVNYTKIGTVPGNISSNFSYLFIDTNPFSGMNFYRLRIIEKDGQVSYSKIIALKNDSQSSIFVYPNPNKGLATIYYYSSRLINSGLLIYGADRRLVFSQPVKINAGANYIQLDVRHLANGLYILKLGERGDAIKLLVQKD